jgi:hypothetical protein
MDGSVDTNMLAVFEPDEYAQYPHVIRMLKGGESASEAIRRFLAYQHYYYGFPFYFLSATSIFPIKLIQGNLGNTQLVMVTLRQMVSVLPMIVTLFVLVYMQTDFQSLLPSVGLFLFLGSIPIVIKNNLWWHPESLVLLFIVLTLFFLDRDKLSFGRNFNYSAIACGLATSTKLIGLFFFITIPVYIIYGIYKKKINVHQATIRAIQFVMIMIITIVISSPTLLIPSERTQIIKIQQRQASAMSFGWGVAYEKGPKSWFGVIQEYYGFWLTILIAFLSLIIGLLDKRKPAHYLNIITWVLPYSLYILFFIAIKPKHFFMPVALPLFSCLAVIPGYTLVKSNFETIKSRTLKFIGKFKVIGYGVLLLAGIQVGFYIHKDVEVYLERLQREDKSESIHFFNELFEEYIVHLPDDLRLSIYRDTRIYVPEKGRWDVEMKWGLIDYPIILSQEYDLILLSQQRILDYTQEEVIDQAADQQQMVRTFQFYNDAKSGNLNGYVELYQDTYGKAFLREDIYKTYFDQ